jgi:hypothetical protein
VAGYAHLCFCCLSQSLQADTSIVHDTHHNDYVISLCVTVSVFKYRNPLVYELNSFLQICS